MAHISNKKLGQILLEAGYITAAQLDYILDLQKSTGKKIGDLFVEEGLVDERAINRVLQYQLKMPIIDFGKEEIDPKVPRLISETLARKHVLIPVKREGNSLVVAMADPMNLYSIDDVNIATGLIVKPAIATKREILNAIDQYYGRESTEKAVEDFYKEYNLNDINDIDLDIDLESDISNAPVVRLVNSIFEYGLKSKASDIHIEPLEKILRIRFRIDGQLHEIMNSSKTVHSAVVTRIKIMGKMDIAEKRLPQDGRVEMQIGDHSVDLRISVLPTVYGEKVVIRLLDRRGVILNKSQLGFSDANMALFEKIIQNSTGMILVTGPTGSGKTTTLYSILKEFNEVSRNIITVEDPVEYRLDGINQVQVNNKAGLTFANGLRSILRQDPDIIMIGEIRDSETAEIAVRAAITGHLVLSTIHTNDAASTITRLIDMGIERYLVSSAVVGVIAQRLVRKICSNCKVSYTPSKSEAELLRINSGSVLYKGEGCSLCNHSGYKGRTSIHEVIIMTKELRELVDYGESLDKIREISRVSGTTSLTENCRDMVLKGITTSEEMLKVAYSLD